MLPDVFVWIWCIEARHLQDHIGRYRPVCVPYLLAGCLQLLAKLLLFYCGDRCFSQPDMYVYTAAIRSLLTPVCKPVPEKILLQPQLHIPFRPILPAQITRAKLKEKETKKGTSYAARRDKGNAHGGLNVTQGR